MAENPLQDNNCRDGNTRDPAAQMTVRREALDRLKRALEDAGAVSWPAPGTQPVLSLWPGLHAGVSLDGTRHGQTNPGCPGEVATCPADAAGSAARRIAGRYDELLGVAGWRA